MQINVAQLLKEGTGATRTHDVDGCLCLENVSAGGPGQAGQESRVEGRATLTRAARGILLQGAFSCHVSLTCVRCLASFPHSAAFDVEEMFYPSTDILTGLPLALPDEDGSASFTIDAHHVLDTSEMIRQYSLLAIPMKPLCRADCAGLCPHCGANLNEGQCRCAQAPRSALAEALEHAQALDRARAAGRAKSRRKQG